jgi:glycosyltransferase involved in cell wall biosynthesis
MPKSGSILCESKHYDFSFSQKRVGVTIVFASHSPFDPCLVVGSHHLVRELAAGGHTILHLGPPLSPLHFLMPFNQSYRARVARSLRGPLQLQDRLFSIEPISAIPWQLARRFLRHGNFFALASNISSGWRRTSMGPIDALVMDDPRLVGLEKLLQPKAVFYRPTDLYAEMKSDPLLAVAERGILSRSAGVVATSEPVLRHALALRPELPSLLLENGVDHRHFTTPHDEPAELKSIPRPRVVYVGAIDSRFDAALLGFLAANVPQAHFIIVGPGSDLSKIRALGLPNVHVLGPRPYSAVPAFLQHSEVGLLPLSNNPANAGRSPMKLYEYGAAGLPVLARKTPELARRGEKFVHLFDSREQAVVLLASLLKNPPERPAIVKSCEKHSWTRKAAALADFICDAPGGVRRRTTTSSRHDGNAVVSVAFNGRFLDQEMTGVQRYSRGMLDRLSPQLRCLRPPTPLGPVRGHLWEQTMLARQCRNSLLWSPGNTGPLAHANQVVTVHDASSLEHPEWFAGQFAAWYRFLIPRLARRVRQIITVSDFSRERLAEACSISPEKISVVYNAIDERFAPAAPETVKALRERHQLERPYVLYVGSLEPRKNLATLLEAWGRLGLEDYELVIVGTPGHVFRQRGFSSLPARARLFGRAAEDELPALFSGAKCFVFPSLYEGFGFPPLEAMACGCPVLCSNTTSLPEVCGPAFEPSDACSGGGVLYFDPTQAEEIAARIRQVVEFDSETTGRLVRNGRARAREFTWDRCVSQTWAILSRLANE